MKVLIGILCIIFYDDYTEIKHNKVYIADLLEFLCVFSVLDFPKLQLAPSCRPSINTNSNINSPQWVKPLEMLDNREFASASEMNRFYILAQTGLHSRLLYSLLV